MLMAASGTGGCHLQAFRQIEPGSGSGLGLAIVQGIVLRYGGTIEIMPSSRGTEIKITQPISES
jgi:two-component system sensor histidine kinase TctE